MENNSTHQGNHRYRTVSAHNTSEGRVAYRRCACGIWQIERFPRLGDPAIEASLGRRKHPVQPVEDAPVERPTGGHLAMSAHIVGG